MRHGNTAGIPGEAETPREAKKSGDAGMPGGVTR